MHRTVLHCSKKKLRLSFCRNMNTWCDIQLIFLLIKHCHVCPFPYSLFHMGWFDHLIQLPVYIIYHLNLFPPLPLHLHVSVLNSEHLPVLVIWYFIKPVFVFSWFHTPVSEWMGIKPIKSWWILDKPRGDASELFLWKFHLVWACFSSMEQQKPLYVMLWV